LVGKAKKTLKLPSDHGDNNKQRNNKLFVVDDILLSKVFVIGHGISWMREQAKMLRE
jgi:predicted nucleic-acid-binding protein